MTDSTDDAQFGATDNDARMDHSGDNDNMNEADVFEAVVDAKPDNPCATFDDRSFTFREFDNFVNQIAHVFLDAGVQPGDRVMLLARNVKEHLGSMLALMKDRAAAVNTNFMYNANEIKYLVENSSAVGAVVEFEFSEKFADVIAAGAQLKFVLSVGEPHQRLVDECEKAGIQLINGDAAIEAASTERPDITRSGDDQWILYTGGTTGHPKGVVWRAADYYYACLSGGNPHGAPRHSPQEVAENAMGGLNILSCAPLMHGAGTFTILTFLNLGAHIIMQRMFEPERIVRGIGEHGVAVVVIVGDAMGVPIADEVERLQDEVDFSSLFMIASGGGIWSAVNRDKFAKMLPNVVLRDNVGASESGNDGEMVFDEAGRLLFQPGRGVLLVNSDLEPMPKDSEEIGFIVRTGHLPMEYLGDPDKSAATFVQVQGQRASLLGDMGQYNKDGDIIFLGRGSGVINTGGEKVFPEEVESTLKRHPAVFDAVVTATEDARYGQAVAAVVSIRADHDDPTEEELREHVCEHLARYKAPRTIKFVDWVQRTPAGKADYRWAKDQVN